MIDLTQRPHVERFIANHLEVLEDILNQRSQEYAGAKDVAKKYRFGPHLTFDRLDELGPVITRETRDFLDVQAADPVSIDMLTVPEIVRKGTTGALVAFGVSLASYVPAGIAVAELGYATLIGIGFGGAVVAQMFRDDGFPLFQSSDNQIKIGIAREATVPCIIAHEYTHFLQKTRTQLNFKSNNPIIEGHARGVEQAIARLHSEQSDNPAHQYDTLCRVARELKQAYLYITRTAGIHQRKSLRDAPSPHVGWIHRILAHHYSMGTAAMSIAEALHGDQVYRNVMRNDISFLKV